MSVAVHAFAEDLEHAGRLAAALGVVARRISLHAFPDGETLPTVEGGEAVAVLYRPLDRPNGKLFPLLQAADACRRAGAGRVVLVAPYLCYLRQDAIFAPGQPLSRDVLGHLLGPAFDRIVTVEPHLHRTSDLDAVFGRPTSVLTAEAELAGMLTADPDLLVLGPDEEAAAWTARVAARLGAEARTFAKLRRGDHEVELTLDPTIRIGGRPVALVDDICSSGGTLVAAARRLSELGASRVEVAVVHALYPPEIADRLTGLGVGRIGSTDSCSHPSNRAALSGLLAKALASEIVP